MRILEFIGEGVLQGVLFLVTAAVFSGSCHCGKAVSCDGAQTEIVAPAK